MSKNKCQDRWVSSVRRPKRSKANVHRPLLSHALMAALKLILKGQKSDRKSPNVHRLKKTPLINQLTFCFRSATLTSRQLKNGWIFWSALAESPSHTSASKLDSLCSKISRNYWVDFDLNVMNHQPKWLGTLLLVGSIISLPRWTRSIPVCTRLPLLPLFWRVLAKPQKKKHHKTSMFTRFPLLRSWCPPPFFPMTNRLPVQASYIASNSFTATEPWAARRQPEMQRL